MEIREAQSVDDAKYVAEIYRSEITTSGNPEVKEAESNRVFKNVSKEFEELGTNRVAFIGFEGDRPIGTVQLVLKEADNDPELANGRDIAHVHHLRVVTDLQKSGLGREMMEYVENYAREHRITKLTLGVDSWNENGIGFYKHLGWIEFKTAEGKNPGEKVIYMQKEI